LRCISGWAFRPQERCGGEAGRTKKYQERLNPLSQLPNF
jgi:hypothetical protein